jgi:ankyrin repeat protein
MNCVFNIILNFSRTPLHRAVTNGNNTKTSCDTMRVLVEYGQCNVMAGTPRYDPTWRGITPFEWYSACPEGFRYLLNQDHSFIDFTEKETVEYLVLDTLLAPSPKQIKLARLALFSIRGPGFQNAVVMKYFKSKATLLHWAVYCLSDISCGLPADRKSCTGHITALLSEILAAGADIHAVDEQGTTPFSYLIGYSYRNRKHFRLTLFSWLNVVQSAGHDLSKYIHKEIKICPLIFTTREDSPSNQAFCDPDHMETRWQLAYQSIKRSMDLETSDASGNLILRFSQEPLWSKKEQDDFFRPRMPGSWKPDAEAQTNWEYVWKYYQIRSLDGCSFCLGPLKNGVQEFGLYGDEACESRQDCGDEKCCPFLDDDSCADAEENDEDFRTV